MKIGIVGHESAKFTPETEAEARAIIRRAMIPDRPWDPLVAAIGVAVVSGGCHLGGVDVWAEQEAAKRHIPTIIHLPERRTWSGGYRERNLKIAQESDEVHVIVVRELPPEYSGMRFKLCYHCHTTDHVKSGACWTGREAIKLGKKATWHVI